MKQQFVLFGGIYWRLISDVSVLISLQGKMFRLETFPFETLGALFLHLLSICERWQPLTWQAFSAFVERIPSIPTTATTGEALIGLQPLADAIHLGPRARPLHLSERIQVSNPLHRMVHMRPEIR